MCVLGHSCSSNYVLNHFADAVILKVRKVHTDTPRDITHVNNIANRGHVAPGPGPAVVGDDDTHHSDSLWPTRLKRALNSGLQVGVIAHSLSYTP